MSFTSLLSKTVVVERQSFADDGKGGDVSTWDTHLSSQNCRIEGADKGEVELSNTGERISATHTMFCKAVDIKVADRIKDGTDYYSVLRVSRETAYKNEHHLEILLRVL